VTRSTNAREALIAGDEATRADQTRRLAPNTRNICAHAECTPPVSALTGESPLSLSLSLSLSVSSPLNPRASVSRRHRLSSAAGNLDISDTGDWGWSASPDAGKNRGGFRSKERKGEREGSSGRCTEIIDFISRSRIGSDRYWPARGLIRFASAL